MVPMSAVHYPMDVTFRMYVRRMTQCQNSEVMMPRILMPGEASCLPEALGFGYKKWNREQARTRVCDEALD